MKTLDPFAEPERFQREARLLGQLRHKNIISVYSFEILEDSTPVMAMELLKGESLGRAIFENDKIDADTTVQVLRQCCEGLEFAHRLGIVHRDLSPANIFLTREGSDLVVKLLDFGLSKCIYGDKGGTLTATGMLMGNPPYMSPEQTKGAQIDGRSDIYSLGCVIYHCMTGRQPLTADSPIGLMYLQQAVMPDEPVANYADQQKETLLRNIALICLQKDPDNRFQSCQEMLDLLNEPHQDALNKRARAVAPWSNARDGKGNTSASISRSKTATYSLVLLLLLCLPVIGLLLFNLTASIEAAKLDYEIGLFLANKLDPLAAKLFEQSGSIYKKKANPLKAAEAFILEAESLRRAAQPFLAPLQMSTDLLNNLPDSEEKERVVSTIWTLLDKEIRESRLASDEVLQLQNILANQVVRSKYIRKSERLSYLTSLVDIPVSFRTFSAPVLKQRVEIVTSLLDKWKPKITTAEGVLLSQLADEACGKQLYKEAGGLWHTRYASRVDNEQMTRSYLSVRVASVYRLYDKKAEIAVLSDLIDEPTCRETEKAKAIYRLCEYYRENKDYKKSLALSLRGMNVLKDEFPNLEAIVNLKSAYILSLDNASERTKISNELVEDIIQNMPQFQKSPEFNHIPNEVQKSDDKRKIVIFQNLSLINAYSTMMSTNQIELANKMLKFLLERMKDSDWPLEQTMSDRLKEELKSGKLHDKEWNRLATAILKEDEK